MFQKKEEVQKAVGNVYEVVDPRRLQASPVPFWDFNPGDKIILDGETYGYMSFTRMSDGHTQVVSMARRLDEYVEYIKKPVKTTFPGMK